MSSQKEMNIVEHLSELRNRLIVTAVFFILFFIVGFIFAKDVYFFFKEDIDFPLHITGITDTLRIYVKIATIIALVGTIPVFSIQLWLFVKHGLTETERKASLKYIPAVVILFIVGLIFGYLIFFDFLMTFFFFFIVYIYKLYFIVVNHFEYIV